MQTRLLKDAAARGGRFAVRRPRHVDGALAALDASQFVSPDVSLFDGRDDSTILLGTVGSRYLTASERVRYSGLAHRRRRQWLAGRVAAKDAARAWLRQERGLETVCPRDLCIDNDEAGVPRLHALITPGVPSSLYVSISHKSTLAAAIVCEEPVGIDIERIEPHEESFLNAVFTPAERVLLVGVCAATEHTRGWVAKEAVAKIAGTGLGGRLREYRIEAREGDCLRVNGRWVVSHLLRNCIVGWSLQPPYASKSISEDAPLRIVNAGPS